MAYFIHMYVYIYLHNIYICIYIHTYIWLMTMGSFRRELTSNPTISPRHHVGRRQVDYVEFCHHLGSCKKRDPLMMSSLTRWGRWTFTLETVGRMWHEIGQPKRGIQLGCHQISVPNLKMAFFVRLKLGCTLQFWLS